MGIGVGAMVAAIFPGQGAQFVGMAKDLHEASQGVRDLFDEASEVLSTDLARIMFDGPAEELTRTEISQPAIFLHSAAVLEFFEKEAGGPPFGDAVAAAGLSLGEYTAHYFAETYDFSTGIRLVADELSESGQEQENESQRYNHGAEPQARLPHR